MQPAKPLLDRLLPYWLIACLSGALLVVGMPAAQGANTSPPGQLVRLKLPLEGASDQAYQGVLQRTAQALVLAASDQARPTLILEFDAADESSGSFERHLSLARFLQREMTSVKTVAYLPRSLSGHAVLIALACEEIAMAPDAELGQAAAGEDPARAIEPSVTSVYRDIASARSSIPASVAAAMVDRRLELLKVEDDSGVDFVLQQDLLQLQQERSIASTQVLSPAGSLAVFTGREARELGFVKYLVSGPAALARVLGLPEAAVRENQATLAEWKPYLIELNGAINQRVVKRTATLLGDTITQHKANWIGLRINSGGGRLRDCVELATLVAELNAAEVRTVAYVPVEAAGGAALVALACDQLIMHPGAKLGGGITVSEEPLRPEHPGQLPPPPPRPQPGGPPDRAKPRDFTQLTPAEVAVERQAIQQSLAQASHHRWSLLAALIDPEIRLQRYTNRQTGESMLLCDAELAELPDAENWQQQQTISQDPGVLKLDARQAETLGIAFAQVDSFDQLKELYGLAKDPPVAKPNWALEFVEALATPWLAGVLLLVAFAGIYLEFQTPGVGIGAFVGSVALLLFFWSHFLSGTAEWLEVLLFLMGIFFLLLEAFVLPGFGIFGLGGAAMVLVSLVLASQTFVLPKTPAQLVELRESLTTVVMSLAGCMILGFVFRRYLPYAPGLRRMLEAPPTELEVAEQDQRESFADYRHLIGIEGIATTNLMPGGRAEIAGELIDVMADGQVIERGDRVVVTSARAARVMVKKS